MLSVHSGPIADDHDHHRSKREVPAGKKDPAQISPRDRPACVNGGPVSKQCIQFFEARLKHILFLRIAASLFETDSFFVLMVYPFPMVTTTCSELLNLYDSWS